MKRYIKTVLAVVLILCVFTCTAVFSAAEDVSNLSDHDDTVSIYMYESVKILTGFVPGESFSGASGRFGCRDRMYFSDVNGSAVEPSDKLFTGAFVFVADGEKVTDVGIFAVFGDADGNGKANSADARIILRHAAGLEKMSAVSAAAADCNTDGKVNTSDARTVLRAAAGLSPLENPIGAVPDGSEPIGIIAYYVGSAPEAGSKLDIASVRVVAVYNDAKSEIIDSGFTVLPDDLTNDVPGKKTFTVEWNGMTAEMTVEFKERVPSGYYPNTKVPDYASFAGIAPLEINHEIGYITYIYPARSNTTDFVVFEAYLNYLSACGFTQTEKKAVSGQIAAVYEKKSDNSTVAMIYDFTGKRIYIAAK